jgi:hypothetical protein
MAYQIFIGLTLLTTVALGLTGFALLVNEAVTVIRDIVRG